MDFLDEMQDISKNFDSSDIMDALKNADNNTYDVEVFDDKNRADYEPEKLFSEIAEHAHEEDLEVLDILKTGKIPGKKIVKRLKSTSLGINLAQLALAKKLGGKLIIIENYLSMLEDKLFNKDNINAMSMEDTLTLYQSTRVLFEKTNDMLMKLQKTIDIDSIEIELKSIAASDEDEEVSLNNVEDLEQIMQFIKDKKSNEK
jgi:hypothetical protein